MKRFLISIAIIFGAIIFTGDNVFAGISQPTNPDKDRVALHHKSNGRGKTNRCPAMPIYGTYDGYTLSIDVVADDEAATYELVVTTAATQTVGQYTAVELNQGIAVTLLQPATIELTTPAGAVYVGEITD